MAVNINTVYLRVLAIANKEQRGYITPQEFNTLANHAQLDIFEQYFYDLNQFLRLPGNDTIHADAAARTHLSDHATQPSRNSWVSLDQARLVAVDPGDDRLGAQYGTDHHPRQSHRAGICSARISSQNSLGLQYRLAG